MIRLCRCSLLVVVAVAHAAIAMAGSPGDRVAIFVPAFEGPQALGRNVATVLNLQISQTLREAPTPNPNRLSFGRGILWWSVNPLEQPSHAAADRAAQQLTHRADMVLWGKAYNYGNGVVVQPYLTISSRREHSQTRPERWSLRIPTPQGDLPLTLDIPRWQYEFEPIVLNPAVVAEYSSPKGLKIFPTKTSDQAVGFVGEEFRARQYDKDMVLLESSGLRGWVHLPRLSDSRSEVVDFVSGLIRAFRADWDGATQLLRDVLESPHTPQTIRIDALLYLGLAAEKQGRSGRQEFERAFALNSLARASVATLIMNAFADHTRAAKAKATTSQRLTAIRRIKELIEENQFLFPPEDPWFLAASAVYKQLSKSN